MLNRISILVLICVSVNSLIYAQSNKYSLTTCSRAYYSDSNNKSPEQKQEELRECVIGKQFPAFSATTITGKKYSDEDLKGKVVLITSWFAACPTCNAEMPLLNKLNEKYKDRGFILLSFCADNPERINSFLKERPLNYEIFPGSDQLITLDMQTSYGYPTNIICSKEGKIVEFMVGAPADEAGKKELMAVIERELSR